MHFFITGHTGFKGAWLTFLLRELGHDVSGYSLAPKPGGLFDLAILDSDLELNVEGDIRNQEHLAASLDKASPDVIIHLAAQPLVLESYRRPRETYTTNVNGTLNLLEATKGLARQPVTLVITTDKVYRDLGKSKYRESDPLGGHDPYSASKAMADILTQSWAATNPHSRLHIARAGNVIGAYDVSEDRLLPDVYRSLVSKTILQIRNPEAVRPWQHVLDCLHGYIRFVDAIEQGRELPVALNFGPDPENFKSVAQVLDEIQKLVPVRVDFDRLNPNLKETSHLALDSTEAKRLLNWENVFSFEDAVRHSFNISNADPRDFAISSIRAFVDEL